MSKEQVKPIDSQWTDEQWKAITEDGRDMLVAAAAGSGKTAVLVERIIKKIVNDENPLDVDRLLVVTFTNASAQEMKKRIGEALEKELTSHPDSHHLRKQLTLLNRASISTLHSFCLQVIRTYYFMIDIDPSFRIANDTEIELLKEEVLEELLEEQFGMEQNDLFFEVVDRYTNDRSDSDMQTMLLKLFEVSRSHPNPEKWLDQLVSMYDVSNKPIEDLPYTAYLLTDVRLTLNGAQECIKKAIEIANLPDGPAPRIDVFQQDLSIIQMLLAATKKSWRETYDCMQEVKWTTLPRIKKSEYDEVLLKRTETLRNKAKEMVGKLKDECFSRSPENYVQDIEKMKPILEKLVELVKDFTVRFQALKREKSMADFTDLEHFCLAILCDANDETKPSAVARQYREKFAEVLVDEYQDTNFVQERILQLVTNEGENEGNLFMVGDVKQSIYRFRLAEPGLFLSKYKRFTSNGIDGGMRIDLAKNFRSRQEILLGTNFIFRQIMGETVGEIEYNSDAELKLGASYPETKDASVEWIIIDKQAKGENEKEEEDKDERMEWEAAQLEARFLANRIKEMVASGYEVYDRKTDTLRPVSYRDFVILLRSMSAAPQMVEECKQLGIPVYAELSTGYFEATEINVMMNVLRVIDNPIQDIPLASVLRSPIVGVTDEELAMLRIFKKKGSFYHVLRSFLEEGEKHQPVYKKISAFYELLHEWRGFARQQPFSDLIWKVYRETGYYDFVAGLPGGKQRQANLRVLYDRARQYEATSFRGLFRFMRFIERILERGDDMGTARAIGEQEDVVRIMTIHKSKGLEFPVVFVAGLSRKFNEKDLKGNYLLHKDLGFGSPFIDPKKRIKYKTLPQLAIKRKMKMEMIAEEMRVLYVALTRAKEKLILIGTIKDKESSYSKWSGVREHQEWLLPDYIRASAVCYMDWIGPALLRHRASQSIVEGDIPSFLYEDESKWTIREVEGSALSPSEQLSEEQLDVLDALKEQREVAIVSDKHDEVVARLNWTYRYQTASEHRAKQTVTEIKRNYQIEESTFTSSMSPIGTRPRFMEKKGLSGAEHGTAVHLVLQHVNLQDIITKETIEEQLARMVNDELLTLEQAESIVPEDIVTFFESLLGQRLQNTKTEREVPFSMIVPASEAYADWNGEEEYVLVQGVIDCMIEEEDGIVLLDFKTDRITGKFPGGFQQAEPELRDRYEIQLNLYSKAVEEAFHKKVKEKYLYFFDGHHIVELE